MHSLSLALECVRQDGGEDVTYLIEEDLDNADIAGQAGRMVAGPGQ